METGARKGEREEYASSASSCHTVSLSTMSWVENADEETVANGEINQTEGQEAWCLCLSWLFLWPDLAYMRGLWGIAAETCIERRKWSLMVVHRACPAVYQGILSHNYSQSTSQPASFCINSASGMSGQHEDLRQADGHISSSFEWSSVMSYRRSRSRTPHHTTAWHSSRTPHLRTIPRVGERKSTQE